MDTITAFREEREQLNEIVLKYGQKDIKRFLIWIPMCIKTAHFGQNQRIAWSGRLTCPALRRLFYILTIRCCEEGVTDEEFEETMTIGLIVGGSITIPRRAFKHWEELKTRQSAQ